MKENVKTDNPEDSTRHTTAMWLAVVSGIFSLMVAGFLILNYRADQLNRTEKEPLYSAKLAELKELLNQNPRNEEIKKEIRRLDFTMRQDYFQRKNFSHRGKYLLLAGVVVFVFALKKAVPIQKTPLKRKSKDREPDLEAKKMIQARKAVSVLGLVLLGSVMALAFMPSGELESLALITPKMSEDAPTAKADYPPPEEIQKNWPVFRGPGGLGISTHDKVPTAWDGVSGKGILWKTKLLLPGHNSPIVWGNRLFISGADKKEKAVFCYSVDSGELLWQGPVSNVPGNAGIKIQAFEETGFAASTMACDGSRVYAIFVDGDIACFDFYGKKIWAKNLGKPDSVYSYASSLICYHNRVLIQYDQGKVEDGKSMLYALEGKTGQAAWQKKRPVANSWTSPILIHTDTGEQLVTSSEPWVMAYNPDTGEELWQANLLETDLAPSLAYAQGMVFVIQPNKTLFAIRTDGRGDVTGTHVAWKKDCLAPEICSPVSNGELVFLLTTGGVLTCYETKTGTMLWDYEYDDSFLASPIIVGEWLYLLSEKGTTYRVKAGQKFEEAEKSELDEEIKASPAFLDGRIFIRGDGNLYGIGSQ